MKQYRIWDCKIGIVGDCNLPDGADLPMRQAIKEAFYNITGIDCDFCLSGWGGLLTHTEKGVVRQLTKGQHAHRKSSKK